MVRREGRGTGRSIIWAAAGAAGALLAGCAGPGVSQFSTNIEGVQLHSAMDENGPTVAVLPKGTPVERVADTVSSSCECWLVSTPEGIGWVYTRYLTMQMADIAD
jgi:outer membrane lipoprotein SlyB